MDKKKKKHLFKEAQVIISIVQAIITMICLIYSTFFK
jgi:hypothetical protein